jgi:uncharacterized protein (TIGR02246 family)
MDPRQIAHSFVEAINSGNPDRLAKLMAADHVFIDSDGSEHAGREEMRSGWKDYFSIVPDFRIDVEDTLVRDDTVVLLGVAEGTFGQDGVLRPVNHWVVPAAWRVVVRDELVVVWQLYVNPEPMVEIMNRIKAA